MSNALAPLEPQSFTELQNVAQVFSQSGMFQDVESAAQAFVKIMAGREAGFGAFASMQNVNIIKGKPTFNAHMMAAAIKRHPRYDYRVDELSDEYCAISYYQDGEEIGVSGFSQADAKRAGLAGGNYGKYPRNMLFARAMSNGMRWYCPDVFNMAVYVPEELGGADTEPPVTITEDGEVIDGDIVEDAAETPPQSHQDAQHAPVAAGLAQPPASDDSNGTAAESDPFRDALKARVKEVWSFETSTLNRKVGDIEKGEWKTIGRLMYDRAKSALGYRNDKHVKDSLGVKSSKDLNDLYFGELLMLIVEHAPTPGKLPGFEDTTEFDGTAGACKECGQKTTFKNLFGDYHCKVCRDKMIEDAKEME
jgi:hypothetical protein